MPLDIRVPLTTRLLIRYFDIYDLTPEPQASRFFDRLMAGVCYKDDGDSKMCLSHIFNGNFLY